MNRRLIVIALGLLCVAQVWGLPTEREDEDGYMGDSDNENDEDNDADNGDSSSSVNEPVELKTKSQIFVVERGKTVQMPCLFVNTENVAVKWSRNGVDLFMDRAKFISGDEGNNLSNLENNTLEIVNASEKDASDSYVCEALQSDDSSRNTKLVHRLIVVAPGSDDKAYVVLEPALENDIDQGTDITLGCGVYGPLRDNVKGIYFSRQGKRLKADVETPNSIQLKVNNATRHVAGMYQCLAENGKDNPPVQHLWLHVKHAPEIEYDKEYFGELSRPKDHYYTGVGHSIVTNITCVVHAHPPLKKLVWLKDGRMIDTNGYRFIKSDKVKSHHVLTINGTTKDDLGQYQCKAINDKGEALGPVIHVKDTPNQPRFKSGGAVDDSIELRWTVISYKPIVQTDIQYRKEGEENWVEAKEIKVVSSLGKEHIVQGKISGIKPGLYEARARARNDDEHADDAFAKWGPYSDYKKFDGEYKYEVDSASVRGSAMRSTVSLMTLLLIISPFAYSCL